MNCAVTYYVVYVCMCVCLYAKYQYGMRHFSNVIYSFCEAKSGHKFTLTWTPKNLSPRKPVYVDFHMTPGIFSLFDIITLIKKHRLRIGYSSFFLEVCTKKS